MRLDRFTERAQEALARSQEIMQELQHIQLDVEQLLLARLQQPEGLVPQILDRLGATVEAARRRVEEVLRSAPRLQSHGGGQTQVYVTPRLKRVFDLAEEEANRLKDEYISTEHLFIAIAAEHEGPTASMLRDLGLDQEKVYRALAGLRGTQRVTDPRAESKYQGLQKYSRDLTDLAGLGKLDPGIGRQGEGMRGIQI